METKYIFVTGGVVSSLGKGISAACLGRLLKKRGLKVFMQKFDPYINIDPGTMSPYQHGEVYVTDDGAETDLDLGHYERFLGENLSKESNVTAGKIYQSVINKERQGKYLGATVQVVPHITDEIKKRLVDAASVSGADVIITEIGGTVGDIESLPFLEAIRQARLEFGYDRTLYIHNTLVPFLKSSEEIKTKPTQHSVKELSSLGIQPDIIILRSEVPVPLASKEKIALFCNVSKAAVFESRDVKVLYEVALSFQKQGLDDFVLKHFHLECPPADMSDWETLVTKITNLHEEVHIGLVGKYIGLHDAYLSVSQALYHAGYFHDKKVIIHWISAIDLDRAEIGEEFSELDGILIPGGFGVRGAEGKMKAIHYARVKKIPLLGICYGMQLAAIEFARDVLKMEDADTSENNPNTHYPVIDYLPNQYKGINLGGTLRLGLYNCRLEKTSKAFMAYGKENIAERHRHRYEFNNQYLAAFNQAGLLASGLNPETGLVEIFELKDHPWFVTCQFHPEFLSRPLNPHPLFRDFIKAASDFKKTKTD
ncbi:MAG TPA: CTP synthase [Bacilli bacterium]|nr:CTP synthase [Bacilli bacterium]